MRLHSPPQSRSMVGFARQAVRPARVAGAVLLVCAAHAATAAGFSCGSRVITEGMTAYEVRAACGTPTELARSAILRRAAFWRHDGRPVYFGHEVSVPVETWIYDFGPSRLVRKLRFVDGVLEDVDTLGHGTRR